MYCNLFFAVTSRRMSCITHVNTPGRKKPDETSQELTYAAALKFGAAQLPKSSPLGSNKEAWQQLASMAKDLNPQHFV